MAKKPEEKSLNPKVRVRVLTPMAGANYSYTPGQIVMVAKGQARALEAAGAVEIVVDESDEFRRQIDDLQQQIADLKRASAPATSDDESGAGAGDTGDAD